jgi:nucleotide-binding universal stress UspA family protein
MREDGADSRAQDGPVAIAMNPMQSILVHMDASPRSAARLEIARQLARQHGARVVCALFAVQPRMVPGPATVALAPDMPVPLVPEIDPEQRARARAIFDAALARGEPSMSWDEVPGDPPAWGFSQASLYADLMVLGQKNPDDPFTGDVPRDFVEDVLLQSGKPGLIVPYAGDFRTVGNHVLAAWKPTRECARAVAGAVPMMQKAGKVEVVCWGEENFAPSETTFGVGRYLRWHGIEAGVRRYEDVPPGIGELLLARTAAEGCDLLVMGCYTRSRLREIVLGGTTRKVLKSMNCPVLMAH